RATLVFYRHRVEYERRWPALPIREESRFSFLLYPLSGGFTRRPLLPPRLVPVGRAVERTPGLLAPLLAFRCPVVLERRELWPPAAVRGDAKLPERERSHLEQQPAVSKAADVARPVDPRAVPDRNVDDVEPEPPGSEKEVEVAERIEVAEV